MKPESEAHLADAETNLDKARRIFAIDIFDQAARLAYYAQFHAAQALIIERTGRAPKTHKGVTSLFHELVRAEALLDRCLAGRLTNSYRYKELADYGGGGAGRISRQDATEVIASAGDFVGQVRRVLTRPAS